MSVAVLASSGFAASFTEIPPISQVQHSSVYAVWADDQPLVVQRCDGRAGPASYVHLTVAGPTRLRIECAQAAGKWLIATIGTVKTEQAETHATLGIDRPDKIMVQTAASEHLYLFADAPEKDAPDPASPAVLSLAGRGVDNTGAKLVTAAIQQAIDEVAARPKGGVFFVPPGVYRIGTIRMKSNVSMYLAAGARLQGSEDPADYPFDVGTKEAPDRTQDIRSRLILFEGVANAGIRGRGEIDGAGQVIRVKHKRVPNLIRVRRSRNIRIEGVLLRRAAGWNTHIFHSDQVAIRDLKSISNWSDGLDVDNSRQVTINDVLVSSQDDSFVIKATNFENTAERVDDISLKNAVLWTEKACIKIGTETNARTMENISVQDAVVANGRGGLVIELRDGALVRNVAYRSIRILQAGDAINWNIRKRGGVGRIEDIVVDGLDLLQPMKSFVNGYDAEHQVRGAVLSGIRIAGQPARDLSSARIETKFADVVVK